MIQCSGSKVSRSVTAVMAVIALAACSSGGNGGGNGGAGGNGDGSGQGNGPVTVDGDGTTRIGGGELAAQLDALPLATLTPEQEAGLLQMREEEKLAHDVYVALYDLWQLKPFSNISAAEQTHSDAVKALLDRYGLDDPAADRAAGEFTDPTLQSLYDSLVEQGSEDRKSVV
jgi:hypothetical protein